MTDHADLTRFVSAQAEREIYDHALRELRQGRKVSHWMWFVFPQLTGLGRSAMAQHYAIRNIDEAVAYVDHEVLGPRLLECSGAVAAHRERSAEQIFGSVDAVKLRSCMTLFAHAAPHEGVFEEVLSAHYGGVADPLTLQLISHPNPKPAAR